MLTAEQIAALRDLSGQLMDPVTEFLIRDIAQRVSEAGQLTGTAAYQTWQLQKLGVSQKKLKEELQKRLKVSQKQVEQLLTQAAAAGYDFDISRFPTLDAIPFEKNTSIQQILDSAVKLAQNDLTNITQTIGFVTPTGKAVGLTDAYKQTCDFAFMKVTSGAQDYISAVREATKALAEKGIQVIDYESGVHTSLEAAVRRNIMGGLGLMQEQISQQNHDDLGCDGWEISAHGGSAPDHEPFQGRQYPDKQYHKINNSLHRRIGTLNCGHSAMPIIFGVNSPQYTDEELEEFRKQNEEGVTVGDKHYTLYEATQRQRSLERSIRKRKAHILVDEELGDTEKLQQDQIRLQILKQRYHEFSKAAGLPEQYERLEKAGFTWKHGKAAEEKYSDRVAEVGEGAAPHNWHRIPVVGGRSNTLYRKISSAGCAQNSSADAANQLIDENVRKTNPAYKGVFGPYGQNCQRCVVAYEMRRRGYDVIARGAKVDAGGLLSSDDALYASWDKVFSGAKYEHCFGTDGGMAAIIRKMGHWGDGSVAEVYVQWKDGRAHVFIAERVNGIVRFVDPQNGETNCTSHFTNARNGVTMIARIDNLEPTELVEKCIKNRGGK